MSFLKTEGFQPSIDSDGDIKFKRQGDVYYVIVSDSDSNPMYLRLIKQFDYSGGINKGNIDGYARDVNKYKMWLTSTRCVNWSLMRIRLPFVWRCI